VLRTRASAAPPIPNATARKREGWVQAWLGSLAHRAWYRSTASSALMLPSGKKPRRPTSGLCRLRRSAVQHVATAQGHCKALVTARWRIVLGHAQWTQRPHVAQRQKTPPVNIRA